MNPVASTGGRLLDQVDGLQGPQQRPGRCRRGSERGARQAEQSGRRGLRHDPRRVQAEQPQQAGRALTEPPVGVVQRPGDGQLVLREAQPAEPLIFAGQLRRESGQRQFGMLREPDRRDPQRQRESAAQPREFVGRLRGPGHPVLTDDPAEHLHGVGQ